MEEGLEPPARSSFVPCNGHGDIPHLSRIEPFLLGRIFSQLLKLSPIRYRCTSRSRHTVVDCRPL